MNENKDKKLDQDLDEILSALYSPEKINIEKEELKNNEVKIERNNNVLTQDDVDALLRGLSGYDTCNIENYTGEDDGVELKSPNDEVVESVVERLPRLEVICDKFARLATNNLSNLCGIRIELNPISVDYSIFGEFMRSLPVPVAISILQSNIFSTKFLNIMDSRAVFSLVEQVFGGGATQPKIEGRDYTPIEYAVIKKIQDSVNESLVEAWSTFIVNTDIKNDRLEVCPQFAPIINCKDVCAVIFYEIEMDTSLGSMIQVIPYSSLEPYKMFLSYSDDTRIVNCSDEEFIKIINERKKEKPVPFIHDKDYLKFLNGVSIRTLAAVLRNEHPQTLASILHFMKPTHAAEFIITLPAGVRGEVISRLEKLVFKNPVFLDLLDDTLQNMILPSYFTKLGSGKKVLYALSQISPEAEKEVREELLEENSKFFEEKKIKFK